MQKCFWMSVYKKIIISFLLFLSTSLSAFIELQVGPEIFFYHRERASGTFQQGRMDAVRLRVERFCPSGIYLGADYFRARGEVNGKNSRKQSIFSYIHDETYEGRIGFCFYPSCTRGLWFVPFIGIGHFIEVNDAFPPTSLCICTTDKFYYLLAGFHSWFYSSPCFSLGLRFETMWMQAATSKISEDPLFEDVTLSIQNVPYVRLELPFRYTPSKRVSYFSWQFAPFYEYRHFGAREGYPFDYIDTKFHLVGGNFSILFIF